MHPFIKILLFMMTLLITGIADTTCLAVLAFLLLTVVLKKHRNFSGILLRMRWLFLSILVIYAFGSPGELVPQFPLYFAPTYEGLLLASAQLARLIIALAALHLLLNTSPRQEMIAGLYLWLLPFRYLGLNVARFAARLTLTLHYVETLAEQGKRGLNFAVLDRVHDLTPDSAVANVHLQQRQFKLLDKLILLSAFALVAFAIYLDMS